MIFTDSEWDIMRNYLDCNREDAFPDVLGIIMNHASLSNVQSSMVKNALLEILRENSITISLSSDTDEKESAVPKRQKEILLENSIQSVSNENTASTEDSTDIISESTVSESDKLLAQSLSSFS